MGEFKVKFRGVRGSYPVCSSAHMKFGGNTSCLEILANGRLIILDAGTGIINLGKDLTVDYLTSGTNDENRTPVEAVILFSHVHFDHIQGLPFFKPAYLKSSKLNMFGFKLGNSDFEEALDGIISVPTFPVALTEMPAQISISNIGEGETIILHSDKPTPQVVKEKDLDKINLTEDCILINCYKSEAHPKNGILIYKIACNNKTIVYASDIEGKAGGDKKLAAFAKEADLLIHDAQYTAEDYQDELMPKAGYGHSTPEMAIDTAKAAKVRQLALFHLDPGYNDDVLSKMEVKAKGAFKNTVVAHEGLEIDLMHC